MMHSTAVTCYQDLTRAGHACVMLRHPQIYRLQKAYTPHNESYQEAQAEAKAAAQ